MNDFVNKSSTTKDIPFIVWTLQRTGGTNLTQRLMDRSNLMSIQHEPFNLGRLHGEITKQWMETKDESVLAEEMLNIATRQIIIKHCVEIVPWEITCALANAAAGFGYQHLFLYRKNARDRLLSLHFARETGVWGPKMKKELDENTEIQPIDVKSLIAHERKSIVSLQRVWQHLVDLNIEPLALSYEEIYSVDADQAIKNLLPILKKLGLSQDIKNDSAFAMEVIGRGDQGTRKQYQNIPGISELEEALQHTPSFNPTINKSLLDVKSAVLPEWVLTAQIDTRPEYLSTAGHLGGVVVLNQNAPAKLTLFLENNGNEFAVAWEKPSPKMAKLYPTNLQAANARFKTDELSIAQHDKFTIYLKDDSGNQYMLFTITGLSG